MVPVIIRSYSKFHDMISNTSFEPVLDQIKQTWIGAAHVTLEIAEELAKRLMFEVLSGEDYAALTAAPAKPALKPVEPVAKAEPVEPDVPTKVLGKRAAASGPGCLVPTAPPEPAK